MQPVKIVASIATVQGCGTVFIHLAMANYKSGPNVLDFEVLIRLPECAISSSYSFM